MGLKEFVVVHGSVKHGGEHHKAGSVIKLEVDDEKGKAAIKSLGSAIAPKAEAEKAQVEVKTKKTTESIAMTAARVK